MFVSKKISGSVDFLPIVLHNLVVSCIYVKTVSYEILARSGDIWRSRIDHLGRELNMAYFVLVAKLQSPSKI